MLPYLISIFRTTRQILLKAKRSALGLLILPLLALVLIGTIAYSILEGWSLLDSLYVTIITITTVGYGDLTPSSFGGRLFAIIFTIAAIGLAGYAISALAALVIEYESTRDARTMEERRMQRIADLNNHMIVCGASSVGHRVANEFRKQGLPFVLFETDEAKLKHALLWLHEGYVSKRMAHYDNLAEVNLEEDENKTIAELADELNICYLMEDPTDEQQLRRVGIDRAKGLIAALEDDNANLAVVLSGRDMSNRLGNENMRIVASASAVASIHRLYLAGATRVVSPELIGGHTVATNMLHPVLSEFWDHMLYRDEQLIRFQDIPVAEHPEWAGKCVTDLKEQQSLLVVAIRRNGAYMFGPELSEKVLPDDVLIGIGPLVK